MRIKKYQQDKPDFVFSNILDLHNERVARYMTRRDLSEKSGVCYECIADYEGFFTVPNQINYNRLARVLGWKLWTK